MPDITAPAIAHPAATVVLLRDGQAGCEVLLVRRNARLAFHGGAWVFPGGRIDAQDYAAAVTDDIVAVARQAAAREAFEEAGVQVAADTLIMFSRWVTPEESPKRFDTWFFLAPADDAPVRVDGGEIHDHRWVAPTAALAAHRSGEIDLPPPTFVTLTQLAVYRSAVDALETAAPGPFEAFLPRLQVVSDGPCCLYAGDVAYGGGDLDQPGPRHRLWMLDSGWRYERTARTEVSNLTQGRRT
jgi:8-oxo-dGTP pyrophosphatase MutT (NUDIX family)